MNGRSSARSVGSAHVAAATLAFVAAWQPAAGAERRLEATSRYPSAEGMRLVVEVTDHDVEVRTADVNEITVTTELSISGLGTGKAERWIASHTPEVTESPDELRLSSTPAGDGFLAFGYLTAQARLRVLAPSTVIPDITTSNGEIRLHGDFRLADPLRLRTSAGSMRVVGAARSIDIRTVSGDAVLDLVHPLQSLFARTSAGSIALAGGARSVEVDTASGDIRLDDLSGPADVATTTGSVALRWVRLEAQQSVDVLSASGSVSLTFPPSTELGGAVTTTGGAIVCDLPGASIESENSLQLAGSGPLLEVETASGDVTIRTGNTWDPPEPP